MNNHSFSKTYIKGEFLYGSWNIISRLIGSINSFLTIYFLTIYEYGSFQLLLVSYAGAVSFLGIGGGDVIRNDILRFSGEGKDAEAKKLFYEYFFVKVLIGTALFLVVFFGAPFLSFRFGSDYIFLIRIISFLFLHDAVFSSIKMIIEMRKKFNIIASRLSLAKLTQLIILLFYLIFFNINLTAVVVSLVISSFVALVLILPSFFDSYAPWRKVKKFSGNLLFKILFSYGKWEILQPFFSKITSFFETWAIKIFINTEAVAIFSIAQTLVNTVAGFFPVKTFSTLIPLEAKNEERLRKIYTYGSKYLVVFSLVAGLGSFIAVPVLIDLFFKKYMVSMPYFKVLLLMLPIMAVSLVSSHFLIVLRRQKFIFFQKILKVCVAIPLYLLLLPIFGLWGLVIHNFLLIFVMMVSLFIYFEKMKPRLYVNRRDILSFGKDDMMFLKNIISDIKKDVSLKLASR